MAGFIVWEGPSRFDGEPVVCIVTGVGSGNANEKIGKSMVQSWILHRNLHPIEAISNGSDQAICGSCPLRGYIKNTDNGTTNKNRGCYVSVQNAPRAIWQAYWNGTYSYLSDEKWKDQPVRLGAYGDPALIPFSVNLDLIRRGNGKHTAYTHQHGYRRYALTRKLAMASVESVSGKKEANRLGWRTFRVMKPGDEPEPDEFLCPASEEAGKRLTCETCLACSGSGLGDTRRNGANVAIYAHGGTSKLHSAYRILEDKNENRKTGNL